MNAKDIFPPHVMAAWDEYLKEHRAAGDMLYDRMVATRESGAARIALLDAAWQDYVGEQYEAQGILDQKLKSLPA